MSKPPAVPPEAPEALTPKSKPGRSSFILSLLRSLWRDRVFQLCLILTLVVNLALFGYLALRYATLPDLLPLHFDAFGLPDRIESKNGIFALPIIGIVVWVLNAGLGMLIHPRERAATFLLTAGALLVQVLLWLAVTNIAGWI
jgi:uncharacterized membrane protein